MNVDKELSRKKIFTLYVQYRKYRGKPTEFQPLGYDSVR